jgi:outer membrane receptor protein involved in Fe transport
MMRGRALVALAAVGSWTPGARAQTTDEVSVRGVRRSHDAMSTSVPALEAREIAGTEGDPVKAVQDLPGVARPSFGTGELAVWGSSPHDTRTYVDGVEIPALFHGAALRSTINAELIRGFTLVPGAYGADYGRGLGGVVRVEMRDLASTARAHLDVDTIDGSAMVSTPVGDRVRVAAAGRYGWLVLELGRSRPRGHRPGRGRPCHHVWQPLVGAAHRGDRRDLARSS